MSLAAAACAAILAGPASAQDVRAGASSAKVLSRKDSQKSDYWFSRDLSNVLTKVVTIKMR